MERPPVKVSLNLMPSFYCKHTGVKYGEPYYFDPVHRAEVERVESAFLHEILGHHGVGSRDPRPSTTLFIQPIDIIKATQGAKIHCPADATLETWGHPWEGRPADEIQRIDARESAQHPVVATLLAQYREMERLYGENADIFGIKAGSVNIHTPYTTAHQLCGESLFFMMADDTAAVRTILSKVWEIYRAIFARLASELNVQLPKNRINMGDCSASMLSADFYRESVLPVNRSIAMEFQSTTYHSCGASSHLLSSFSGLPHLESIELGPGTDLAKAVREMPEVAMRPLVDPVAVKDGTASSVESLVTSLLDATAPAPSTTLCAWSFDRETPIPNLEAIYQSVDAHNRTKAK